MAERHGGRLTNDRIRELLERWKQELEELSPLDIEAAKLRNKIIYYEEMIAPNERERARRLQMQNSRRYRPLPMLDDILGSLPQMEIDSGRRTEKRGLNKS